MEIFYQCLGWLNFESLGSSMATSSRFFILQFCIHSGYKHLKVAIELLGFAVLWPLFIDSEKWP